MEIKLGNQPPKAGEMNSRAGTIPAGATVIAPVLKKESVVIDKFGNHIDLATKQIIKRKDKDT